MTRAVLRTATALVAAATVVACAAQRDAAPPSEAPPLPRLAAASTPAGSAPSDPSVLATPSTPTTVEAAVPAAAPSCQAGMVLVDGDYCTEVREPCLEWADPPEHNVLARCAKYGPTTCVGEHVHKRFCIDRDEFVATGQTLPTSDVSWTQAKNLCAGSGKRLCKETEWEFACEGEQMMPYPTGYDRDAKLCNFDKDPLLDRKGKLLDLREPENAREMCVSPFGVRNMSGNVDEWVYRDRTNGEWRSALKGGWWMPARDRCRPATTAHDENFHQLQTGVRCCADPG